MRAEEGEPGNEATKVPRPSFPRRGAGSGNGTTRMQLVRITRVLAVSRTRRPTVVSALCSLSQHSADKSDPLLLTTRSDEKNSVYHLQLCSS